MKKVEFAVLCLSPRDSNFDRLVQEYENLLSENEDTNWSCITNKTATPSQRRAWELKEYFNFVDPVLVRDPSTGDDEDENPTYTCPSNMYEHTVSHKNVADATNDEDSPAIVIDIENILKTHPGVKKLLVRLDT